MKQAKYYIAEFGISWELDQVDWFSKSELLQIAKVKKPEDWENEEMISLVKHILKSRAVQMLNQAHLINGLYDELAQTDSEDIIKRYNLNIQIYEALNTGEFRKKGI